RDMEVLSRNSGGHDVRVVAVGDGDEGAGFPDAGLFEELPVEPRPDQGSSVETGWKAVERVRSLVDDGDGVSGLRQLDRKGRPDAATPNDHDVHEQRVARPTHTRPNRTASHGDRWAWLESLGVATV